MFLLYVINLHEKFHLVVSVIGSWRELQQERVREGWEETDMWVLAQSRHCVRYLTCFTCEHFSESTRSYPYLQMGDTKAQRCNINCIPALSPLSLCSVHPPIRLCGLCQPCPSSGQRDPSFARAFPSQGGLDVMYWELRWGKGALESGSLLFLWRKALHTLSLSMAPFFHWKN